MEDDPREKGNSFSLQGWCDNVRLDIKGIGKTEEEESETGTDDWC